MAINFPDSPSVGDEFTGGGFTWTWNGSSWEKLATATTTGNGFSLLVGSSGNTTYTFESNQPAGAYSLTSQLGDTTFDIYLISENNANVGYTNTTALEATEEFNRVVVYSATTNDILNFDYKPSSSPETSGDVEDGVAPFITSATPTTLAAIDDSTTVTGGNFANDVEIIFTGQDAVDRPAKNIVRSSSTSLLVTRPDDFPVSQEPFTMTATNSGIVNPSLGVNKLINYFDAGGSVSWVTSSSLPGATRGVEYSTTISATDADGTGVAYSLTSGSLPSGISINLSTGEISGTPTQSETQSFTVTATDLGGNSSSRQFSLAVVAPVLSIEYLVVAGGGGGGWSTTEGGGGGAGGYRSSVIGEQSGGSGGSGSGGSSAESVFVGSESTNYTVTIGAGGVGQSVEGAAKTSGSNSVFNNITSIGGGFGGTRGSAGASGGSGGGAASGSLSNNGTAGQGYRGGPTGGGGGGAGEEGNTDGGSHGGDGLPSSITGTSIYRAGGGGGGRNNPTAYPGGDGGGGAGGNTGGKGGASNYGGGGGGGGAYVTAGGSGGSGVVILRYPLAYNISVGAGLTSSTTTVGDKKVTTFTAGSDTISFSQDK